MPSYFVWLKYLSVSYSILISIFSCFQIRKFFFKWFGYGNRLLVMNQWEGIENLTCVTNNTICFRNGKQILDYLKVDPHQFTFNIVLLFLLTVIWRFLAFIALLTRAWKNRSSYSRFKTCPI